MREKYFGNAVPAFRAVAVVLSLLLLVSCSLPGIGKKNDQTTEEVWTGSGIRTFVRDGETVATRGVASTRQKPSEATTSTEPYSYTPVSDDYTDYFDYYDYTDYYDYYDYTDYYDDNYLSFNFDEYTYYYNYTTRKSSSTGTPNTTSYISPLLSEPPKNTTEPATTKPQPVNNPWNRQSRLATDIYARGKGTDPSILKQTPSTRREFMELVYYMNETMTYSINVLLDTQEFGDGKEFASANEAARSIYESLTRVSRLLPESYSNCERYRTIDWKWSDSTHRYLDTTISYVRGEDDGPVDREEMRRKYNNALQEAQSIVYDVSRYVPNTATEREMAVELMKALADRCVYYNDERSADCTWAYGALVNGSANCTGYSSGCAMLFKLAGLDCFSISREDKEEYKDYSGHMWLVAYLDGEYQMLDPTGYDQKTFYAEIYAPRTDYQAYLEFEHEKNPYMHKFSEEEYRSRISDFEEWRKKTA